MLQQILQDMCIDPDLLAELDEEQKQILFCKLREEQVRRWRESENAFEEEKKKRRSHREGRHTKIKFLEDASGQPWTWVMGEHPSDKTVEQILEEEEQERARRQAEAEAEELRKRQEEAMRQLKEDEMRLEMEASARRRQAEQIKKDNSPTRRDKQNAPSQRPAVSQPRMSDTAVIRRRDKEPSSSDIEMLKERRSSEIYMSLQLARQRSVEQAEQDKNQLIAAWKEQEKKAKQAEQEKRLIAKRAREDHVRAKRRLKTESQVIGAFMTSFRDVQANSNKPAPGGKVCPDGRPPRPNGRESVIAWYKEVEEPKGVGLDPGQKHFADYFFGMISRQEAEALLTPKAAGTFLIRLSDRVWGYALSYRSAEKCKHYLIDASDGRYRFFGTNQLVHNSLAHLVTHHRDNPVSMIERAELLVASCGTSSHDLDSFSLLPNSPEVEISYL